MECPNCNGKLKRGKYPYSYSNVELGEFEADKCQKCGEIYFTEKASDEIDQKAKEKGVWGLGKKGTVGYSGNSLIIRVPKEIAAFMGLENGREIFIRPEGKKRLVVEID